jgi:hypothetical protein
MDELQVITDTEKDVLIQVLIENSVELSVPKIMKDLILIDDLLKLQKSAMLFMPTRTKGGKLRKHQDLQTILIARIDKEIEFESDYYGN